MDRSSEFTLCGFQRVSRNGFSLPCYWRTDGGNLWYVARSAVSGDPNSRIIGFDSYGSAEIERIGVAYHRTAMVGDIWQDVFLWKDRVHVGRRYQIILEVDDILDEIIEDAPLTAFDLLFDNGRDDVHLARSAASWLRQRTMSSSAKRAFATGILGRVARLRFRRLVSQHCPDLHFDDSDFRIVEGVETDFVLQASEKSKHILNESSKLLPIFGELSAIAEAGGVSLGADLADGGEQGIRPTPTFDRGLPRRFADFRTLGDALEYAARGRRGLNFHDSRGTLSRVYYYSELYSDAVAAARRMISEGIRPSDRVAIIAETGPNYAALFFGAVLAGALPTPLPLPTSFGGRESYIDQIMAQMDNCSPSLFLFPDELDDLGRSTAERRGCKAYAFEEFQTIPAIECELPITKPTDACYLQYSSGSTRLPQGILVTHEALLSNLKAHGLGLELKQSDRCISWLPWYHDLGLVGCLLSPIANQVSVDFLRTEDFARRPLAWLDLITRNQGTSISYSPTFGYEICFRRISSQVDVSERFDLARWRIAGNGADMIRPDVMQSFTNALQPAGFKSSAFLPSYGLAEATLVVTLMPPGEGIKVELVEEERLSGTTRDISRPARYRAIVNCGKPVRDMEVEIRGENDETKGDHQIGKVWCRGPSVMHSYFRNSDATAACLVDGWLSTGDMGYMADGYVFIVGRAKDMIIINGKNLWPQDIEWAVEQLPGFNHGDIAAFAVETGNGEEAPAVLVHCRVSDPAERIKLREQIMDKVRSVTGMSCVVELVPPRTLPRTSTGKLSRAKAKKLYLSGELEPYILAA